MLRGGRVWPGRQRRWSKAEEADTVWPVRNSNTCKAPLQEEAINNGKFSETGKRFKEKEMPSKSKG